MRSGPASLPTSFTQTGEMGEVGRPAKRAVSIQGTKSLLTLYPADISRK